MIVSRVTAPAKEEGAEVDGGEEVGGVAVCVWGRRDLSYASVKRYQCLWHPSRKIRRNRKGNGKMAKNLRDSRRKNKLITGRHIPVDINKG